jgi:genome maintenance exonuclease 1
VQRGDIPLRPRRGDDPLAIPRLQVKRLEVGEERYYQVDGLTLPSVSTILRVIAKPNLVSWARRTTLETVRELLGEGLSVEAALSLAEVEPERQRDAAAQRGGLAHEAIACALMGKPYPPEWEPWVKAALDFLVGHGLHCVAVERVVWSRRHGFAGTVDLVACQVDGALVVTDWKSGSIWPEHALQLGAYTIALEEMTGRPVGEAYVVGLREKGYEAKRVNLPLARRAFLAALSLWRALRGELYE